MSDPVDTAQKLREALPKHLNSHASADEASRIAAKQEHGPEWTTDAASMHDIRKSIEQEKPAWRHRLMARLSLPRMAPLAITALASICIILAWLLWQVQGTPNSTWRSVPGAQAPVANLRVQFKPEASISQMEEALDQAHAGIVTGPLPGHIYLLDALDAAASLQSLKNSSVVADTERIETPASP